MEHSTPGCFNLKDKMANPWLGVGIGALIFVMIFIGVTVPVLTMPERTSERSSPMVDTPFGQFQGAVISVSGGSSVIRYAGIPFAQPPTGKLRFKPPLPLEKPSKVNRVVDASHFKKSCWSITKKINNPYYDEDCLYLNVYAPSNSNKNNTSEQQNYSTMIWIHGGGFVAGSIFPEPTMFVAKGNVIVVTFSYRLGVFGFLTTNDSALPANNGLLDQLAAFKWVNENIKYFGGDPNSVTIAGESAGAISAALHAISPMSSQLFNRVIMQSGAATSLLRRNPIQIAEEFGNNVGCSLDNDTMEFASCLQNISVGDILSYSKSFNFTDAQKQVDFIWLPVIDGNFIVDDPSKLLDDIEYLYSIDAFNKDYLVGFNDNDGSLFVENFMYPTLTQPFFDDEFFSDLLDYLVDMKYGNIPSDVANNIKNAIRSFYISSSSSYESRVSKEAIIDIAEDSVFYAPILNMANSMSMGYKPTQPICGATNSSSNLTQFPYSTDEFGKTFVYFFDFCPPQQDECRQSCMTHGLQLLYTFPKKESDDPVIRQLTDKFISILSDFVKTGQPEASWLAYEKERQSYFSVSPYSSVRNRPFPYRANLWIDKIPNLLNEQFN